MPLVALVALWWRFAGSLFRGPGRLYLIDESLIDVPFRVHAAELLRAGHFPFWTSLLECGFAQFADSQTGVLYPLFFLYLIWPTPFGNDIFVATHFLIAALLMYVFLAARGFRPWPCLLGSAAWFGGPILLASHVIPGFIATLAWLPLALLAIDRGVAGSRRWLLGCALLNSTIILAGMLNSAAICFVMELGFLAWLTLPRRPLAFLRSLAFIYGLPALLTAMQLLPTYDYFRQSHRGEQIAWGAVEYNCVRTWHDFFTMGVDRAVDIPTAWPAYVLIAGIGVALSLSAAARGQRRSEVLFWLALGGFGALIATGSPLLRLIFALPIVGWFRWPMFYVLMTHLALAALICLGFDFGLERLSRLAGRPAPEGNSDRSLDRLFAGLVAAATIGAALAVAWRTLAPCKSVGDFYSIAAQPVVEAARHEADFRLLPLMRGAIEGGEPGYRQQFWTQRRLRNSALTLAPNYSAIHHVPVAILKNQADAVTPRELTELVFASQPPTPGILKAAGVTHLTDIEPLPASIAERSELLTSEPVYFYRLNNSPGRAWMVYRAEHLPDARERLLRMRQPEFDPATVAVVEQPLDLRGEAPAQRSSVKVTEPAPGRLLIRASGEAPGLLVVADRYAPEIEATVDGEPADLLRVNHAFRGVALGAGEHVIEMRYVPRLFFIGLGLSGLGLAIFGLAWFGPRTVAPSA